MDTQLYIKELKNDLIKISILATICACVGLAGNQLRDRPLPLVYQSKQERLNTTVLKMSQERSVNNQVGQLAAQSTEELPDILSLDEVSEIVDKGSVIILDARPEVFYRLGHIPGSLSLPRDDFQKGYNKIKSRLEINKHQSLIVYCSSSSCQDSGLIVSALEKLGYQHISVFKGGWSEWQNAGLPEETVE
ncbi:MAG: rhodanese-like domain-containing protein [Verrucomicrobiota bacterium]